jgi:hypothetical protein
MVDAGLARLVSDDAVAVPSEAPSHPTHKDFGNFAFDVNLIYLLFINEFAVHVHETFSLS